GVGGQADQLLLVRVAAGRGEGEHLPDLVEEGIVLRVPVQAAVELLQVQTALSSQRRFSGSIPRFCCTPATSASARCSASRMARENQSASASSPAVPVFW